MGYPYLFKARLGNSFLSAVIRKTAKFRDRLRELGCSTFDRPDHSGYADTRDQAWTEGQA